MARRALYNGENRNKQILYQRGRNHQKEHIIRYISII